MRLTPFMWVPSVALLAVALATFDLGPLGAGRRQILLVHVGDEDAGRRFDVPAEDLERVAA